MVELYTAGSYNRGKHVGGWSVLLVDNDNRTVLSGMEPDGKQVITYKEAMILEKQPKSLVIIGAGAIGVEFAHFYQSFGTDVTIIEALPSILPIEDNEISAELDKIFKKRKMNILTNIKVDKVEKLKNKVRPWKRQSVKVHSEKRLRERWIHLISTVRIKQLNFRKPITINLTTDLSSSRKISFRLLWDYQCYYAIITVPEMAQV